MSRRRIFAPLLVAIVALGAPACREDPEAHPNVLLITVDTLRPDRLGAYGYDRIRTPNIDRLAAEGALFENVITDTPWTTPSMSSVMTGTYATVHGFKSTNANRLAQENVTLAEVLGKAGYTTAAVVGSFPLDAVFQLDQGFDRYDDDFTTPIWVMPGHEFEHIESEFFESPDRQRFFILSKALNDSRREDAEVTDAALAWLSEERVEPFFLWVHYFGPHEKPDWTVAEERRELRRLGMYDPDTEVADREVGRLVEAVDALGLAENTLVVFHSDHGESLGEHGLVGHGQLLNDATMRIPLIMRYPARIERGVRVSRLTRNVDVFPTVLDVVGIASERELSGESLLPLVGSSAARGWAALRERFRGERVAYMETYYPAHVAFATPLTLPDGKKLKVGLIRRGVQTRDWKYVKSEPYPLLDVAPGSLPEVPDELKASLVREELYHLAGPSGEKLNVVRKHPEVVEEMRALFEGHLEAERGVVPSVPADVDPEMKLRLKSLGYGE
jgi:arylsulfatase A-like enzyme